MKIALSSKAIADAKGFQKKIEERNKFASKRFGPMISEIVIEAIASFKDAQIERISNNMVSPAVKKKALADHLQQLAEQGDMDLVLKFERSIKRKNEIKEKSAKTQAISVKSDDFSTGN